MDSGVSTAAFIALFCGFQGAGAKSPICEGLPMAIPTAITPTSPASPIESGVEVRTRVVLDNDEVRGLRSGDGGRPWMGI
jgi:hypothetical protein